MSRPSFIEVFRRREDFLRLRFAFHNLQLDLSDPADPRLVRKGRGDATVVVGLEPQAIGEEAFYELDPAFAPKDPGNDDLRPPAVGSRLSGRSRLSFRLPDEVESLPYTPAALLDWLALEARLVPAAVVDIGPGQDPPAVVEPGALDTVIEMPWWLILSPLRNGAWAHAVAPVTHDGRTEIWHTRLAVRQRQMGSPDLIDESEDAERQVRAVWTRDPLFGNPRGESKMADGEGFPTEGLPFRMPMSPADRRDVVRSSADWPAPGFTPSAVSVDRLLLTTMGGWLDSHGQWQPTHPHNDLVDWRHVATAGRDHYVRIIKEGFLLPFGHRAVLLKITERKFKAIQGGLQRVAYLFQRYYVVVREREKTYPANDLHPDESRQMAWRKLRINSLVTPNLDPPEAFHDDFNPTDAFVPRVGEGDFRWVFEGTDWAGQKQEFVVPAVFVAGTLARDPAVTETLVEHYAGQPGALRQVDLGGRRVAVAPPKQPCDTDLELGEVELTALVPTASSKRFFVGLDQPAFYPAVARLRARLVAAEVALGKGLGETDMVFYPPYLSGGFGGGQNAGEVFATLSQPGSSVGVKFEESDRSGALITPNLGISGLSRTSGAVGGTPDTMAQGTFDPEEYFGGLDARILGGIDLMDVIDEGTPAEAIQMTTQTSDNAQVVRLSWSPTLRDSTGGPGGVAGIFEAPPGASLELSAELVANAENPAASSQSIVGELRDFRINLIGTGSSPPAFVALPIKRLTFTSKNGQKPDIKVEIGAVEFKGILAFVRELESYLPSSGTGPSIDVTDSAITASVGLQLPSVEVGVFSLQNISFDSALNIPFSGEPVRFRFGFCSRENPFLLSVTIFGGGGFFALGLGVDGVEMFEAALEFGGNLSLDIGVASGGVHVMAGIYFKYEELAEGPSTELTGYVRLGGELCVIGLVSMSLEFYLALTYWFEAEKMAGTATMTVEVDVLLFSGSVSLTVERRFGGNDPRFGDAISPADWDEYCDAFAPIGVTA